MKTILITTSSFGQHDRSSLEKLKNFGFSVTLNPYKRKLTEGEVASLVKKYKPVGMIAGVEPLTKSVFENAKNLKTISRCGIGMDSIDMEAVRDFGITVTNTPDAPTIPVAELTLGLILTLLRKIHLSDASIRKKEWYRPMGHLLHGKIVGIIGCGRIGSHLGKLIEPFDCKILGYDPFCPTGKQYQLVDLNFLLSHSDIVSLHFPYNPENHHFMDTKKIQNMKKGAFLINAARGGLVDENALYNALISEHLSGAALDCFEKEPYLGKLRNLNNVLLSGHIGSYAIEGRIMMEKESVENLLGELKKSGALN
jgi:D-3-phosphoglycerate dehydrogenase / 2-oxoglutarate reductase